MFVFPLLDSGCEYLDGFKLNMAPDRKGSMV